MAKKNKAKSTIHLKTEGGYVYHTKAKKNTDFSRLKKYDKKLRKHTSVVVVK